MEEIALFVIPVLITIFVFALLKGWMDQKAEARSERVRLLEEALKNPAVDRATIESLTYQLTGQKNPNKRSGAGWVSAVMLGIGWIGLFVGIGLWVVGDWQGDRDVLIGGVITALIGFGLVTYPFALRELEARRAEQ